MWKWARWVLLGIVIVAIGVVAYLYSNNDKGITDFASCAKKYPVMETYPEQCQTKDGKTYVKDTKDSSPKTEINNQIQEEIETNYYEISGVTKDELLAQISALGPDCGDGQKCTGYTDTAIDWTSPVSSSNVCSPVSVIARVDYTMPNWTNKDQAPENLQSQWDAYIGKLQTHEENHKNITVKNAQLFLEEIKKINAQTYSSCDELEEKISDYFAQGIISNKSTAEHQKYDLDTNHGATEGVVF